MISPIPPDADFWYARPGLPSASGMLVSPEAAMQLSAVYACVRVCAETLASLPCIVYKRLPDGGKVRALDHPLYDVLHDQPNIYQTSFEFWEMMQGHLELRGNAFAHIIPGPRGAIDSLIPIHPDRVQVYRLENGRLRYQVRQWWNGALENFAMEEIWHLRGISSDGIVGMSTVSVAREQLGTALAQQEYSARFFANDSRPSGVLQTENELNDTSRATIKAGWQEANTGMNRHKVAVLEQGLKYQAISVSNKDSQFIETQQFQRGQIASLFRVPPHKIGDLTKATFSNIEQQSIEFVTDCMRPRVVRVERRIATDLIEPLGLEGEYFAEFLMDALLRGDLKSRYASYAIGRNWGWLSPNDVCQMENRNPIAAEKGGDDYLRPLNMVAPDQGQVPPGTDPTDPGIAQEDAGSIAGPLARVDLAAVNARLKDFALMAAARVVRKEVTALRKAAARVNGDLEKYRKEVTDFYSTHATFISETMRISIDEAEAYVARNQLFILEHPDVEACGERLDFIEETCGPFLAELALKRRNSK
jgi:HK97 family phage portal protein